MIFDMLFSVSVLLLLSKLAYGLAVDCDQLSTPSSLVDIAEGTQVLNVEQTCYIVVYKPMTRKKAVKFCAEGNSTGELIDNFDEFKTVVLATMVNRTNVTYHAPIEGGVLVNEGEVNTIKDDGVNSTHAFICKYSSDNSITPKVMDQNPFSSERPTSITLSVIVVFVSGSITLIMTISVLVLLVMHRRRNEVDEPSSESSKSVESFPLSPAPSSYLTPSITKKLMEQDPISAENSRAFVDLFSKKQPSKSSTVTGDSSSIPPFQASTTSSMEQNSMTMTSETATSRTPTAFDSLEISESSEEYEASDEEMQKTLDLMQIEV